jgi:hypothetical protein
MTPYISFFCVNLLGEWPGVRTCEERTQNIPIGYPNWKTPFGYPFRGIVKFSYVCPPLLAVSFVHPVLKNLSFMNMTHPNLIIFELIFKWVTLMGGHVLNSVSARCQFKNTFLLVTL